MTMFYRYVVTKEQGKDVLYLYYVDRNEFAQDFNDTTKKATMQERIGHYIKNCKIPFSGDKVYLVVDGVITGTFSKADLTSSTQEKPILPVLKEKVKSSKGISNATDFIVFLEQKDHSIIQLSMEQYLLGVLASEILPSFHMETLKAQAVLCRTYAIKKMLQERRVQAVNENQIYRDPSFYKFIFMDQYETYIHRLKEAIKQTKGQYLAYEKQLIDPIFHSVGNGVTDLASSIGLENQPYLTNVVSAYDQNSPLFLKTTSQSFEQISKQLQIPKEQLKKIQILEVSPGKRIQKIKVGDQIFTGMQFVRLLGLNSNSFSLSIRDDKIEFTTHGLGHGVGLSQYGANEMAERGISYPQILSYYYPNTKLWKLVRSKK